MDAPETRKKAISPNSSGFPQHPMGMRLSISAMRSLFSTKFYGLIVGYNTLKYEECTRKLAIPPKKPGAESKGNREKEEGKPRGKALEEQPGNLFPLKDH